MSEWISVEDELPEEDVDVLVYYHGLAHDVHNGAHDVHNGAWVARRLKMNRDKFGYYPRETGCEYCSDGLYSVTHWMPLPEAPEVNEEWKPASKPPREFMFCEALLGCMDDRPVTQPATYNLRDGEGWRLMVPGNWNVIAWREIKTPNGWQKFLKTKEVSGE